MRHWSFRAIPIGPTRRCPTDTAGHTITGTSASKGWNIPGLACAQLILSSRTAAETDGPESIRSPGTARHRSVPSPRSPPTPRALTTWRTVVDYLRVGRDLFAAELRRSLPSARLTPAGGHLPRLAGSARHRLRPGRCRRARPGARGRRPALRHPRIPPAQPGDAASSGGGDGLTVGGVRCCVLVTAPVSGRRSGSSNWNAWRRSAGRAPAPNRLGDWLLRAGSGFTGRANSVLPLGSPGCAGR